METREIDLKEFWVLENDSTPTSFYVEVWGLEENLNRYWSDDLDKAMVFRTEAAALAKQEEYSNLNLTPIHYKVNAPTIISAEQASVEAKNFTEKKLKHVKDLVGKKYEAGYEEGIMHYLEANGSLKNTPTENIAEDIELIKKIVSEDLEHLADNSFENELGLFPNAGSAYKKGFVKGFIFKQGDLNKELAHEEATLIEHIFDIGDEVYYLDIRTIKKSIVRWVVIEKGEDKELIQYVLEDGRDEFEESLFGTPREVRDSLKLED